MNAVSQNSWYRNPEMIVALSALVVSLFTVGVGAYSAWIDRAYTRAAVWPRLEMGQSYGPGRFGYFVSNRGTGPALIRYVRLTVAGQPMQDWAAVFDALEAPQEREYVQSQLSGRTLSAGQDIQVLQTHDVNLISPLASAEAPPVSVRLCYCSIYDQCWVLDEKNQPQELDHCELPDTERFEQ